MLKKLLFLLLIGFVSGCYFRGEDESPYIYEEPDDGEYGDDEGDYGDEGDEGDEDDEGDYGDEDRRDDVSGRI